MYDEHVGVTFYYDGLGSTRSLTDINGSVTDTYLYNAYGNLIDQSGSTSNQYLFTGEQFDSSLGQYYLRARYYNPAIGTFHQMDTFQGRMTDPLSLNKYTYSHADPINFVDYSGNDPTLAQNLAALTIGSILFTSAVYNTYQILAPKFSYRSDAPIIYNSKSERLSNKKNSKGVSRQGQTGSPPGPDDFNDDDEKLPKHLRSKLRKIENLTKNGEWGQVTGRVTQAEARQLGERFVGRNYTLSRTSSGGWQMRSADGLRQVRGPSFKPTDAGRNVHPQTLQPYSGTGWQMNFESRFVSRGSFKTNIHLDVIP